MEGITGAVHETGHALYEQGRSAAREGLPVSAAAGMAVHESQSLLWERMVALSLPFCRFLLPKLRAAFPAFGEGKSAEASSAASLSCQSGQKTANQPTNHSPRTNHSPTTTELKIAGPLRGDQRGQGRVVRPRRGGRGHVSSRARRL